jgi:hypothetical protein
MGYEDEQIRCEIEAGGGNGDHEEGQCVRTSSEKVERAAMASSTGMAMSPARPRPQGGGAGAGAGEAVWRSGWEWERGCATVVERRNRDRAVGKQASRRDKEMHHQLVLSREA